MHDERYTNRELHGILFKNTRKKRDEEPDYTGTARIHGKDMKVSGWIKEAKNKSGNKFMQLAFTEVPDESKPIDYDDIPF